MLPQALVLHSLTSTGRHLLTTVDIPPLLIGPVAANHCRAGVFLLRVVTHHIASRNASTEELSLSRADVPPHLIPRTGFPEIEDTGGDATIRLRIQPAPADDDIPSDPDDDTEFLTLLPPTSWDGDLDAWLTHATRALGLNIAPATPPDGYHALFEDALQEVQRRVPDLRARFRTGLGKDILALKVGLATTKTKKTEFVWCTALDWSQDDAVSCRLESSPQDCPGYTAGQTLDVATKDIADYMIGGEEGCADPGLTQLLAEDYGLIIT